MLILKLARQSVESEPTGPGRCPRCGCEGWHKWGSPKRRKIVDLTVGEVSTQRYRCKNCGKTVTSKPKEGDWRSPKESHVHGLAGCPVRPGVKSLRY